MESILVVLLGIPARVGKLTDKVCLAVAKTMDDSTLVGSQSHNGVYHESQQTGTHQAHSELLPSFMRSM